MVIAFARTHGRSFQNALSYLLSKRSLNKSSISVQNLNFNADDVRGDDLKLSILSMGQYSKNSYAFKSDLKREIGAKSDRDLIKKIVHYEFVNPLMLVGALGAQFNRLERRYLLSPTTFKEAYIRKYDQFNTLLSLVYDLKKFGLSSQLKQYIFEFSSEIVDPHFNLTTIDESKATVRDERKDSENSDSNNDTGINDSAFTFDGNEIMYNITDDLTCTCCVNTPLLSLYKKKRQYFGNSERETIFSRYAKTKTKPRFCDNGACWDYNFGYANSPHAKPCQIKTAAHLLLHYCAAAAGPHPILVCPFLRCTNFLSVLKPPTNWFNVNYDFTAKYPAKPYKKEGGNKYGQQKGKRGQTSSGNGSQHQRSLESSRSYDPSRQYDSNAGYYDNRDNSQGYQHDNRHRGGRGGNGNGNRRNNGRGDRDKQNNHNGQGGYHH